MWRNPRFLRLERIAFGYQSQIWLAHDLHTNARVVVKCIDLAQLDGSKAWQHLVDERRCLELLARELERGKQQSASGIPLLDPYQFPPSALRVGRLVTTFKESRTVNGAAAGESAVNGVLRPIPSLGSLTSSTLPSDELVYFVLSYVEGAPLNKHIAQANPGLAEKRVKFHAAELVRVLGALHERGFAYRDLKASNIIIQPNGRLTLIDFGFCKYIGARGRAFTFCGTSHAMAPEIYDQKYQHNKTTSESSATLVEAGGAHRISQNLPGNLSLESLYKTDSLPRLNEMMVTPQLTLNDNSNNNLQPCSAEDLSPEAASATSGAAAQLLMRPRPLPLLGASGFCGVSRVSSSPSFFERDIAIPRNSIYHQLRRNHFDCGNTHHRAQAPQPISRPSINCPALTVARSDQSMQTFVGADTNCEAAVMKSSLSTPTLGVITSRLGYSCAVDWWALGILIYEMIYKAPPFGFRDFDVDSSKTIEDLCRLSPSTLAFNPDISVSAELKDIVSGLLQADVSRRLGSRGGTNEIIAHPWFKGFPWKLLDTWDAPGPEVHQFPEKCWDDVIRLHKAERVAMATNSSTSSLVSLGLSGGAQQT